MAKNISKDLTPSFESLSMEDIIGAPLVATAKANASMAQEQVRFMMNYCFYRNDNDKDAPQNYQPVMIQMEMTRTEVEPSAEPGAPPSLTRIKSNFELPLLTLVPLNSLAVDEVNIDFDMEVTAMEHNESKGQYANDEEKPKLMGKVGAKQAGHGGTVAQENQRKMTANLSINVKASPLPLPVGLTSVIDLYAKNIHPKDVHTVSSKPLTNSNEPKAD